MRSIRISHIVLTSHELAEMIFDSLKDIDNRELLFKTFRKMAIKYSACTSRFEGGDLGFLEMNSNAPELEKAAMETPLGQVGGPTKSKFGYHVYLVTEEDRMGDTGVDGIFVPTLR